MHEQIQCYSLKHRSVVTYQYVEIRFKQYDAHIIEILIMEN